MLLGRLDERRWPSGWPRAAIYALPARYEPFGLSALEAALSGCALVLGDIPSLREVWGDAAVFVPPDDAGGLRDALYAADRTTDDRAQRHGGRRARAPRPDVTRRRGWRRRTWRHIGTCSTAHAPVSTREEKAVACGS